MWSGLMSLCRIPFSWTAREDLAHRHDDPERRFSRQKPPIHGFPQDGALDGGERERPTPPDLHDAAAVQNAGDRCELFEDLVLVTEQRDLAGARQLERRHLEDPPRAVLLSRGPNPDVVFAAADFLDRFEARIEPN